jgi:hypothetical protein
MKKRYVTYFGVPIPPFKEEKLGAGATPIRFVLTGKMPAKKNNQQAVTVRRYARYWANEQQKTGRQPSWADVHKAISMCRAKMRGNAEYIAFVDRVRPILEKQMIEWSNRLSSKGLIFPISKSSMSLRLYFKDRHARDTINIQQSIQDVLVDAGVIIDDNYNAVNPVHAASACYYEEIIHNIAFITLSLKL